MANWYGTSRSNYFRVKDETAFRKWADGLGISIVERKDDTTLFAVHPGDRTDDGSWPSYDLETDEVVGFEDELAKHLLKGQIAVLITAGAERLRYISGSAVAVNHQGRAVVVMLDDIYQKAAHQFRVPEAEITRAEY
jgi:hypothetical protein